MKPGRKRTNQATPDEGSGGPSTAGGPPFPLAHTMLLFMAEIAEFPAGVRKAFRDAVRDYETGFLDDAGFIKALGLDSANTKGQRYREFRRELVPALVEQVAKRGKPKTDPSYFEDTAFHVVAKGFAAAGIDMSPTTVYDIYRGKR